MSTSWPRVPLGEVIDHRKEFIIIDDLEIYRRPRVQLHAQGIVLRDAVPGAEINTKRQQVARAGEFLVAEIDAKVGGFGIVPRELDGSIVSSHYFLYGHRPDRLDNRYLGWFVKTRAFREQVEAQGSTNYAAIRPNDVLGYELPLPPLEEQRRIVARIEELAAKLEEARQLRATATEEVDAHWPATLKLAFDGRLFGAVPFKASAQELLMRSAKLHAGYRESNHNNAYPHRPQIIGDGPCILQIGWCWTTLASVLTHMVDCVNDTPNFSDSDTGLLGLKTTNVRPYRLDLQRRWYMTPDDFASWNRRQSPQAGDIVLTREAPVGNVCMVPEGISACLTQRLMLLRAENRVIQGRYLLHFLNSPCFTDQIAASGRGQTHPHIRVGDAPHFLLPLAPMEQQVKIVAELDALQAKLDLVKALQAETAAELDAMVPAILDKAFKGEL